MKYCKYCGAEMLDEAVMCPKCGRFIDGYYANKLAERKMNEEKTEVINGIIDENGNVIPMLMDDNKKNKALINDNQLELTEDMKRLDRLAKLGFGLSFFIPIVGICISAIPLFNRNDMYKDSLKFSIAGIVVGIISLILSVLINLILSGAIK